MSNGNGAIHKRLSVVTGGAIALYIEMILKLAMKCNIFHRFGNPVSSAPPFTNLDPPTASRHFEREKTVDGQGGASSVSRETERYLGAERAKMGILRVGVVYGFRAGRFRVACIRKGAVRRNIAYQ